MQVEGREDATIDELERLEKVATPGPWHAVRSGYDDDGHCIDTQDVELCPDTRHPLHTRECWTVSREPDGEGWCTDSGHSGYGICEHDAALIAAMRNALPALLEELRRLREACEGLGGR